MKPHPRIRKMVKWGGAVVTLLLVWVWIGSGWMWVHWGWTCVDWVDLGGGGLYVHWCTPEPGAPPVADGDRALFFAVRARIVSAPGWDLTRGTFSLRWAFAQNAWGTERSFFVPIWPLLLITVSTASLAWRLDTVARRRTRAGFCPKCNYDRNGLAAGVVCPECGRLPS